MGEFLDLVAVQETAVAEEVAVVRELLNDLLTIGTGHVVSLQSASQELFIAIAVSVQNALASSSMKSMLIGIP